MDIMKNDVSLESRVTIRSSRLYDIFILLIVFFILFGLDGCNEKNPVKSEINGWKPVGGILAEQTIQTFAADPRNTAVLYAGTVDGVYKSTDVGATWSVANAGLTSKDVTCIAVSPLNNSVVFCGTWGKGVCKSKDGGLTWQGCWTGGHNPLVKSLAVSKNGSQIRVWVATNQGLFLSIDEGVTWLSSGAFGSVYAVYGYADAKKVVTSVKYYGVYQSLDGGGIWQPSNTGLANDGYGQEAAQFLCVDADNPQIIAISTDRNVCYRSTDSGVTWQVMGSSGFYITERVGFVQEINLSKNFWLASSLRGVLRSRDNGLSWYLENNGLDLNSLVIKTIFAVHNQNTVALIGTVGKGIYRYEE